MDPQATLEIIHNGDIEEAYEASEDLREWILDGGYMPKPTDHKSILNAALGANDREEVIYILANYIEETA